MVKKKTKTKKMEPLDVEAHNDYAQSNTLIEPEVFDPSEMFNMENGQTEASMVKELFSPKNPKVKSELSHDEIMIVSRLYVMSKKFYEPRNIFLLKSVLDEFVMLRISKDRKSREEFVKAHQEAIRNKENSGIMDRLMGNSGGIVR